MLPVPRAQARSARTSLRIFSISAVRSPCVFERPLVSRRLMWTPYVASAATVIVALSLALWRILIRDDQ